MPPPQPAALTAAVAELYKDRAEPKARLLQWKVHRLFGVELTVREISRQAAVTPCLRLDPAEPRRSRFSVFFKETPLGFAGFADDIGIYEEQEAEPELMEMLRAGGWPSSLTPEHQAYEIAGWLCCGTRHQRSFGHMLTFVKRAHSVLNVLGTSKGRLVLYHESDERIRRINKMLRTPTGVAVGERYVADEEVLCDCLQRLLYHQRGWLWMADIKRLFRERFCAEISETVFGCASMTELLSQPFILARFAFQPDWERGCGYLSFARETAAKERPHRCPEGPIAHPARANPDTSSCPSSWTEPPTRSPPEQRR